MLTQLGECCRHMAKVVGSSPIHPTIRRLRHWTGSFLFVGAMPRSGFVMPEGNPITGKPGLLEFLGGLSRRIFCPVF